MVDGRAKLVREDYCDGLGSCLPVCPAGAISFEAREAPAFSGCPGGRARALRCPGAPVPREENDGPARSELMQWPVQIKLVPAGAPYFDGADLLVAADCTAYACAGFHREFIRNHIALIGCPKLDEGDYAEKLMEIIKNNDIKSVKVVRMEVPCCGGLENAVKRALRASGKMIPWRVAVISTDGRILEE